MKSKISIILAATLISVIGVGMVGCGKQAEPQPQTMEAMRVATVKEAPVNADPESAIDAIYQTVEENQGGYDVQELDAAELEKLTGITNEEVLEFSAYYSNPKSGLADVIIVKPYPSLREDVRGKLIDYREERAIEFENFDILGAHDIAKNAVIYDQSEYLVLLMLKDNETAQQQIDMYIPQ